MRILGKKTVTRIVPSCLAGCCVHQSCLRTQTLRKKRGEGEEVEEKEEEERYKEGGFKIKQDGQSDSHGGGWV